MVPTPKTEVGNGSYPKSDQVIEIFNIASLLLFNLIHFQKARQRKCKTSFSCSLFDPRVEIVFIGFLDFLMPESFFLEEFTFLIGIPKGFRACFLASSLGQSKSSLRKLCFLPGAKHQAQVSWAFKTIIF